MLLRVFREVGGDEGARLYVDAELLDGTAVVKWWWVKSHFGRQVQACVGNKRVGCRKVGRWLVFVFVVARCRKESELDAT